MKKNIIIIVIVAAIAVAFVVVLKTPREQTEENRPPNSGDMQGAQPSATEPVTGNAGSAATMAQAEDPLDIVRGKGSGADRMARRKAIHKLGTKIKKKDLEFPGLNYISEMVRDVLINFLIKQEGSKEDNIPWLALKDALVNLKLNENETIQKGSFIKKSQIKYKD